MYLSSVFCAFVTVFLFVESKKCTYDFNTYEEVSCPPSKEYHQKLMNAGKTSKCHPHLVHVPLKPESALHEFYPSVAYVKRCSGHCRGLACMPFDTNSTKIIKVPAKLSSRNENDKPTRFVLVDVEEHTACKCGCQKKKEDCPAEQELDEEQCLCVCKDQENKKHDCEQNKEMAWDSDNCECITRTQLRDRLHTSSC